MTEVEIEIEEDHQHATIAESQVISHVIADQREDHEADLMSI